MMLGNPSTSQARAACRLQGPPLPSPSRIPSSPPLHRALSPFPLPGPPQPPQAELSPPACCSVYPLLAGALFTHVAPSLTLLQGQSLPPLPTPHGFLISSLWHLTQHLAFSRPVTAGTQTVEGIWSPTFGSSSASLAP